MKTKIILLFISALSIISCGKDGNNGNIYLQLSYYTAPIVSYKDNNPGIPKSFNWNQEYKCTEGTYQYEYVAYQSCCGNVDWSGSYTLEPAHKGEKGSLFTKGKNGDDRHYTFTCYGYIGGDLFGGKKGTVLPVRLPDTTIYFTNCKIIITRSYIPVDKNYKIDHGKIGQ